MKPLPPLPQLPLTPPTPVHSTAETEAAATTATTTTAAAATAAAAATTIYTWLLLSKLQFVYYETTRMLPSYFICTRYTNTARHVTNVLAANVG